jgi:hypothetical protein
VPRSGFKLPKETPASYQLGVESGHRIFARRRDWPANAAPLVREQQSLDHDHRSCAEVDSAQIDRRERRGERLAAADVHPQRSGLDGVHPAPRRVFAGRARCMLPHFGHCAIARNSSGSYARSMLRPAAVRSAADRVDWNSYLQFLCSKCVKAQGNIVFEAGNCFTVRSIHILFLQSRLPRS